MDDDGRAWDRSLYLGKIREKAGEEKDLRDSVLHGPNINPKSMANDLAFSLRGLSQFDLSGKLPEIDQSQISSKAFFSARTHK